MIDDSTARPLHVCRRPRIIEFGPPLSTIGVPTMTVVHPPGTRYHCVCGVYVVHYEPGGRRGRGYVGSGYVWRRETRAERRSRLGLRWWQRAAKRITPHP